MTPAELVKQAQQFEEQAVKPTARPRHELPSRSEQDVLDRINRIKGLVDAMRLTFQRYPQAFGWFKRMALKHSLGKIESYVRNIFENL